MWMVAPRKSKLDPKPWKTKPEISRSTLSPQPRFRNLVHHALAIPQDLNEVSLGLLQGFAAVRVGDVWARMLQIGDCQNYGPFLGPLN